MTTPLLQAHGIVKNYGHVQALRGADFAVQAGEVVALIGDNGAGKSTLVKVLAGVTHPDGGEIRFSGRVVSLPSPTAARAMGIETVYQDLALAPDLDPAANLFLGRELVRPGLLGRLGFLDKSAMAERTRTAFAEMGAGVQSDTAPVGSLSGGQRQSIAVGRAAAWASKVVFMDEPTAALGVVQASKVLDLIRRVRDQGIAVVLISHSMPQVFDVADRIEVLRLGQRVARFDPHEADMADIVGAMTGALEHGEASTAEPGGSSEQARQRGPSGQEDA
ncbi:ATP-binding cassette domain-containing protein [soil metagenome]